MEDDLRVSAGCSYLIAMTPPLTQPARLQAASVCHLVADRRGAKCSKGGSGGRVLSTS
jgi:hypothetical protein